jgi:hypothetical protein
MCQVYTRVCIGGNCVMPQVDLVLLASRCLLGRKLASICPFLRED